MTFRFSLGHVFACALLSLAVCAAAPAPKRIALTFDDVPRAEGAFFGQDERTRRLIGALDEAGVEQAAFFLNPGMLADADKRGGTARIAAYVEAGHVIANHSMTHPRLQAVPLDAFIADIDAAESWLEGREGRRQWFRFPYLDAGGPDTDKRDAVRAALAERNLLDAWVSVNASDWWIDDAASKAVAEGRALDMNALRDFYVARHVEAADFYDDLARRTIGRSPAHVMLPHETDLAALFVDDLVAALREAGWEIVSADEAFADPVYREAPEVPFAQGTLFEQMAWAQDLPEPRWFEMNRTEKLAAAFEAQVAEAPHQSDEGFAYASATLLPSGETVERAGGGAAPGGLYQFGSISKYACTLLALSLAEEGRLDLDAPVARYLPAYRGPAGSGLTLSHLLENRSGLPDGLVAAMAEDESVLSERMTAAEAADRFAGGTPVFEPGEAYDYAISNWILVQAVLEEAGDRPLAALLDDYVFGPAGMEGAQQVVGVLSGPQATVPSEPVPDLPAWAGCAGGIGGSAADLLGLMRFAHAAGFSQGAIARLTTVVSPESSYALGGRILHAAREGEPVALTWLSGSNGPFESFGAYDPVRDTGFAVVTGTGEREQAEALRDAWFARSGYQEAPRRAEGGQE
ncbi:serine hydrolase [Parvularcula oceani]|uniref:serine hydrolase n=1 Tax=Parvularcula oceani TaxID=1247963 RepID=UPI000B19187E|nr:serine hydrolase [Parvularcula oceani]